MLTIGLLSVSREVCLRVLDEIEEKLKGTITNKILIEDVFNPAISRQIVDKATKLGWKVLKIGPMPHGKALEYLISICRTKYLVYWEDDVIPTMDIDLDQCVKVMEASEKVNTVSFNVYPNMSKRHEFVAKEETFDGVTCTIADKMHFTPGVWRLSKARKVFKNAPVEHLTHKINKKLFDSFGGHHTMENVETYIGCWFYGPFKYGPMTEHIGGGQSAYLKEHKRQ